MPIWATSFYSFIKMKKTKITKTIRHLLYIMLIFTAPSSMSAQSVQGVDYYLPKSVMRFTIKVERTLYKPGQFAPYANRYLRKNVSQQSATSYRLIDMDMDQLATPDTSKHFTLVLDKKHLIDRVSRADNGQLLAINADVQTTDVPERNFAPAPKSQPLNPNDFMSEDILNAGSIGKMAELTAREIYDIRDSKNQLNRGEADYMPKDGTQLKIMLANLDRQETALSQLFEGTITRDTTWTTISYTPLKEGQEVLFRFSKHLGLVESDDLSGEPYYIIVKDAHTIATPEPTPEGGKPDKNDIGLRVSQPGKILVTISNMDRTLNTYELIAPQFGTIESLSGELFNKKQSSKIVLDSLTGSVKTIESTTSE